MVNHVLTMVNPDHFYPTMVDPEHESLLSVAAAVSEHGQSWLEHNIMVDHGQFNTQNLGLE